MPGKLQSSSGDMYALRESLGDIGRNEMSALLLLSLLLFRIHLLLLLLLLVLLILIIVI